MKKYPVLGIIFAILTILAGSWAADALSGDELFVYWFPCLGEYRRETAFFTFLIFIVSFLLLFKYRKDFLAVRGLSQHACTPHAGLIILLSSPNKVPSKKFPMSIDLRNENKVELQGKSLTDDIKALEECKTNNDYWNWEQLLRGIKEHQNTLKYVYLIGSKETKRIPASFDFLDHAKAIIRQYCPNITFLKEVEPIDFENFNELVDKIAAAIKKLKEEGINEKDIIIDITGGQKTASIAGAAVTLSSNVTFQYVQTDDPWKVQVFDVTVQSPISI